jgi:hypothetical protein
VYFGGFRMCYAKSLKKLNIFKNRACNAKNQSVRCAHVLRYGALAQLGERNTGSVEVSGSIPLGSTKTYVSPSSRGLGHRPFTAATGVRIPLGMPINLAFISEKCLALAIMSGC